MGHADTPVIIQGIFPFSAGIIFVLGLADELVKGIVRILPAPQVKLPAAGIFPVGNFFQVIL